MSKYQEKVLSGQIAGSSDWMEYLKAAHKLAPGMTPKAFGEPKTANSKNSYQVLVESVGQKMVAPKRVLDLACGDGHLTKYIHNAFGEEIEIVGVDMSEGELAVAKAQHKNSRSKFKCESADTISESDQSFDLVFCHMALMLMDPIEPILREVARVLKSDGFFAGVVNGGPAKQGFLLTYQRIWYEFVKNKYPNYKPSTMGDSRTRSSDGLSSLLCLPHFKETTIRDFDVIVKTTPEGAAQFFENMYNVSLLPSAERIDLKSELVASAKNDVTYRDGKISFEFPMRFFMAAKA